MNINELDFNNAGSWPLAYRIVAILLVAGAVAFSGYWFYTSEQLRTLEAAREKESQLKQTYQTKQAVAANLDAYREQMENIQRSFGALLLQLPSKTEIAELLVDISRVGLESGLEFELFKPGNEIPKEFYAEFPIKLRVTGTYHQLGNFASGIAALPRIVTLHNLKITSASKGKEAATGTLRMDATANTYRYLDKEEIQARNAKDKKNTRKKKRR